MIGYQTARLTLTDADNERYSIPNNVVSKPNADNNMRLDMVGFSYNLNPFSISFKDSSDPTNVFVTTENQNLLFSDKYIQMDFKLPSQRLYGLGERIHEFQLKEGTWTMWASGYDSPYDDGSGRNGTYGVHPFVLVQSKKKGDYFGMYFRNSNAMSPVLKYTPDGGSVLSFITIGGQIEAYFFIHGNAKSIIQQYNSMAKPNLPPYWALGWQQASWKYLTQDMITEVLAAYDAAEMGLETIYLDIPYMDNYADFSINKTAFPDIPTLMTTLKGKNRKIIPIIDGAISADNLTNEYYQSGDLNSIFIKSGLYSSTKYNNNLISKVWPERAVFVDWLNDKSADFIKSGLDDLYSKLPFDGLWIDMNEATTFKNGEIKAEDAQPLNPPKPNQPPKRSLEQSPLGADNSWYEQLGDLSVESTYDLPFVPRFNTPKRNFDEIGMSLNATHYQSGETEYNLHNLYGHMMSWRFNQYLTQQAGAPYNTDNRPLILTRSSFSGTGQFASHWLGDNWRSWDYMRYSVAGMMNMNMFGIPHVGADVCGFFGEVKEDEMCGRWIQLSTFYPMARAHQNLTWKDGPSERSEPYLLTGIYKDMAQKSIADRYSYLRHMYTCLYEVSQWGGSCIDPLFFFYPDEDYLYDNVEESFMVGSALKVSPIYAPQGAATSYKNYFPKGKWVSLINFNNIIDNSQGGKLVDLTYETTVQVHLREGTLIAYQDNKDNSIRTTTQLLPKPIILIVNPDEQGHAEGTLFLDGGISRAELNDGSYRYYKIIHNSKSLQKQIAGGNKGGNFFAEQNNLRPEILDKVWITNAARYNNVNFACLIDSQFKPIPMKAVYKAELQTIEITKADGSPDIIIDGFRQIMYGNDQQDVNLCDPKAYQYSVDGAMPNLTLNNASVNLKHPVLPDITVQMNITDANTIHVHWSWTLDKDGKLPQGKRTPFKVPDSVINPKLGSTGGRLSRFISVTDKPFQINFLDNDQANPQNLLSITGLIYDQFFNMVQMTLNTPKADQFTGIFGLGTRSNKDFFFKDGVYSMFDIDNLTPDENGLPPGNQQYGTQPFFMYKHKPNLWAGVLSNNVNAQDWWVKNSAADGTIQLNSISTGGYSDFYVILGSSPDMVVSNYYNLVGNPVLQPNWALGWHQCRWGYKTLSDLQTVVEMYQQNGIPLDVAWSDIDYKKNYRSFTIDQDRYANMSEWLGKIHNLGMKWVPIVDIGISNRPGQDYPIVDQGYAQGVFQKIGNEAFIGRVWPGDTVYPDFAAKSTTPWWQSGMSHLHDELNITFDGLWLDMNENSNFCNGACYDRQKVANPIQNNLPYIPGDRDLEFKTLSMDVQNANGEYQLDYHSIQSTLEVKASHEWFEKQNKRTFLISRSNSIGLGKYGNIWLGDNFSKASNMGYSVSGVMLGNMYGIGLLGGDICGFIDNTTPELCARWHVLGSYYPFSRNHNNYGQTSQEPYVYKGVRYEEGIDYMSIMINAIYTKYSLNRYYYSELTDISLNGDHQFFKPLFYAFPEDIKAYSNITYNIMLGDSLKLSINSDTLNQNTTWFYFPAGTWCNILNPVEPCFVSQGAALEKSSKAYDSYLHLLAGAIIPFQNAKALKISTTKDLQKQPIDLHIHLLSIGKNWRASGDYLNDDGEILNLTNKQNSYSFIAQYSTSQAQLSIDFSLNYVASDFNQTDQQCFAVNMSDYISTLYFYNAVTIGINAKYLVNYVFADGTIQYFGQAAFDTTTRILVATAQKPVCMTKITTLTFFKLARPKLLVNPIICTFSSKYTYKTKYMALTIKKKLFNGSEK